MEFVEKNSNSTSVTVTNKSGLQELSDLIPLDVDAVEAYTEDLKHIKTPIISKKTVEFKRDPRQHIEDILISLGEEEA